MTNYACPLACHYLPRHKPVDKRQRKDVTDKPHSLSGVSLCRVRHDLVPQQKCLQDLVTAVLPRRLAGWAATYLPGGMQACAEWQFRGMRWLIKQADQPAQRRCPARRYLPKAPSKEQTHRQASLVQGVRRPIATTGGVETSLGLVRCVSLYVKLGVKPVCPSAGASRTPRRPNTISWAAVRCAFNPRGSRPAAPERSFVPEPQLSQVAAAAAGEIRVTQSMSYRAAAVGSLTSARIKLESFGFAAGSYLVRLQTNL